MRKEKEALRGCPWCRTPVKDLDLGVKDFRWLRLPGKVGAMDVDFYLDQASTGRRLVMEFKPTRSVPPGQRISLKGLYEMGCDVWIVEEVSTKAVRVGKLRPSGNVKWEDQTITLGGLNRRVNQWWEEGRR